MEVTYSWLIYSCLIFGIDVYCDGKLEKRQTISSCTVDFEDAFNCSNGLCIDTSDICDGQADCSDGSDETNDLCAKQTCQSYEYRCSYGACVDKSALCNGKNDCVDGSDENLPECIGSIDSTQYYNVSSNCLEDQYKCISGQCIDEDSTCDGYRDCNDASDETLELCQNIQCPKYTFRCNYGACVSKNSKCDGVRHCVDGSDEEMCRVPNNSPVPTVIPVIAQTQTTKKSSCVLPIIEGVIYSDESSNEILSHGTLINHYRTVIENCEVGYHKAYPYSFRVCQGNGKWISKSDKLCFMCGRSYVGHQLLIDNGKTANVGTAPWNVGIYRLNKDNSKYDLICGGSLIAPNFVISAAHCFWQDGMISNRISINDSLYKIAVGKYDRDYSVIDNEFTQIIDVETIYLKEDYLGYNRFYSDDIAVIVLKNKVNISDAVAPVCIDWNDVYNVTNGTEGKIVGWGYTENDIPSPVLLEATLPYIDYNSCRCMYTNEFQKFVTFDKFCAGSISGQGVREGDSGAGLTFLHFDFYYLTGIVSLRDPSTKNSIAVFTNVVNHIKWLRELYNKYASYERENMMVTTNACVLPIAEGVIYSYEDSDTILSHGTLINPLRIVIENCEIGYHKAFPSSFRVCQGNGEWKFNSETLCFKMCPPLLSDSLDVKCTLNGDYANCSNPSILGTKAIPSCKLTHTIPNGQEETPIELLCQSNGAWNNQLHTCVPYCGRPCARHQPLIDNGNTANVGTAPWNVGIYRFKNESSMYDLICGGSLISQNLVVSVAHCFWHESMSSNRIPINDGSYKVAVGKYTRNYTVIDNEFTQIMDVDIIYLKKGYHGTNGFHGKDIAIIVLKNRVAISVGVAPVCVDWNSSYNLTNAAQGKIVGWGFTGNHIPSPVLLKSTLSYIDQKSCRIMYTNGFEGFVTIDKFCAGSELGQTVLQGDSGAGLTFLHSNSYYLTGLVSVKDPNTNHSIAVFTNVKHHIKWLRELYNKYASYESDNMMAMKNTCVLPTAKRISIYSHKDLDKT